jgi:aminopeptidase N
VFFSLRYWLIFEGYNYPFMSKPFCLLTFLLFTIAGYAQPGFPQADNCIEKCNHAPISGANNRINYFQYPSMDKYDVRYVKLDLAIEANNRNISGNALIRSIALAPMDSFICELKNNMVVDSVFINGTKITTFTRGSDCVFVPLSPAIPGGTTITALFYYRGVGDPGGVFAGNSGGLTYTATLSESYQGREWFPVKQILKDKIDSADVWITTSATNLAGSNGLLQSIEDVAGGKKQFRWKTRYKINYYLLHFAVANYREYKNYAKPAAIAPDSILIQHYVVDNTTTFNGFKPNLDKTPAFIEKLSELFGLYPFRNEKYGHVQANIGGGMEHQTMSTMSSFGTGLIAHELGHQWFGDNVTCATWNHIWINEGFASYSEYLLTEKLPALFTTPAATLMLATHTNVMSQPGGSVFVPNESLFDENRIFSSRLSYDKGSAIIHNLRFEMQDDNLFFQTLRTFQQQYKDSVATAEDFKAVAQTVSGKNFTTFFDQWYYGQGYPTFNVDYSRQGDSLVLFVAQTTSMPSITPFFKGLYEITINTQQGDTTVKINLGVNGQTFKFRSNRIPTGVVVDPNNWVINKVGSITTGTNGPANVSKEVKLFPNPSPGTVFLQFPSNWFEQLSIYDVDGRLVQQFSINRSAVSQTITNNLPTGLYLLRLDGKGKRAIKKLIVQ